MGDLLNFLDQYKLPEDNSLLGTFNITYLLIFRTLWDADNSLDTEFNETRDELLKMFWESFCQKLLLYFINSKKLDRSRGFTEENAENFVWEFYMIMCSIHLAYNKKLKKEQGITENILVCISSDWELLFKLENKN